MDPITTAILAAVTAGVTGGVTEVGKKAVVDAYGVLKARLAEKFGADSQVVRAVAGVEEEPDFKPNQDTLAGRVEQVRAVEDPELQELAQVLLQALKNTPEGQKAVSKYHIVDSEVGVAGDHAKVEGGIHFGSSKK